MLCHLIAWTQKNFSFVCACICANAFKSIVHIHWIVALCECECVCSSHHHMSYNVVCAMHRILWSNDALAMGLAFGFFIPLHMCTANKWKRNENTENWKMKENEIK